MKKDKKINVAGYFFDEDFGFAIKKVSLMLTGGDFSKDNNEPLFNFLVDFAYSGLTKKELRTILKIVSKKINKAIKNLDKI